jgi:ribosomal protein S18 acetylase RimI-like enzyme
MALPVQLEGDSEALAFEIVDIRQLIARDLNPLLREETTEWGRELDWDLSKSAELVRRLADARELGGVALLDRGEVAGYGYCGLAGHRGQIWDVYVRRGWRGGNAEAVLFRVLLDTLIGMPGVLRVESQLMLLGEASAKAIEPQCRVRLFERLLMMLDMNASLPPGKAANSARFRIEPWCDEHQAAAATVLSLAHVGHIDSQMSDQYRTFAAANQFVGDLAQFPGCSAFCPAASYVAFDAATGQVAGISLASFVADDVAHVAELCVTPDARGAGLGYELLRQSAAALGDAGAKRISLTVTAANAEAIRLYTRCGFREIRRFHAFVWESDILS